MFNVSGSIRLAEEEAGVHAKLSGLRKRTEYLEAALHRVAEIGSESDIYSPDTRDMIVVAKGAVAGTWTRGE